ncbi:MAG TPA: hypothetical protein VMM78_01740 [Thermomicrobiales bacterium]|nr:hypothetical protein [Thermomicrobiales bacterium]
MIDAAREARKGDEEARAWLERQGLDLLGALIPASVEPEYVIACLLAGRARY